MKNETKTKLTNKQAQELWKSFNYSFYWLNVLVAKNEISKAQAGVLINNLTNKLNIGGVK